MNTSKNTDFYEAILLADYAMKMALVELTVLDQQSIKVLQTDLDHQSDTTDLMEGIKNARNSLKQAGEKAKRLVNKFQRVEAFQ